MRTFAVATLMVALLSQFIGPLPALAQDTTEEATSALPIALQPDGVLPLEGTPWRLTGYRTDGGMRPPGPEVAATMSLVGGALRASGGCTAFRGSYGIAGSAIGFDLASLKENDCAGQTMMVQRAMEQGLRKARRFEIDTDTATDELILFNATDGELLRFALDDIAPTVAGDWLLEAYTIGSERVSTDSGMLRFDPERSNGAKRRERGALVGATGCNGFTADFFRQASVLSLSDFEEAGAPCTEPLQRQQDAILSVLDAKAIELQLPADRLVLTSRDTGDTLELRAAAPLEGTTWVLQGPADRADPGRILTLRLGDGTVSGEGPCGTYGGRYATDGLFISFLDLSGPDDADCRSAGQARALLAALRAGVRLDRAVDEASSAPSITIRDARGEGTATLEAPFASGP